MAAELPRGGMRYKVLAVLDAIGILMLFLLVSVLFYLAVHSLKLVASLKDVQGKLQDFISRDCTFQPESKGACWSWFVGGLLLVFAGLYYMESSCSFVMFLRIDNILQFSPVIVDACRNFFDHGVFPEINPYQFMGNPTSSTGIYSLTYPVTYIAYAIARFLCHNELMTIDVFCIIHILLAYAGAFLLAKKLQVISAMATMAGICYALCGYHFVGTFYWYYIIPTAAFLPFLILCLICIKEKPSWGMWLVFGLIWGIYGHNGSIQLWIYTVMFLGLATILMFLAQQLSLKKIIFLGSSLMLGVAISAILLIPQYLLFSNIKRNLVHMNLAGTRYLLTLILPQNLIGYPIHSEIDYANTMTALLVIATISFLWLGKLTLGDILKKFLWIILGVFALMLAYDILKAWTILHSLPIFNKFRMSVKFLTYTNFFLILGGIVFFNHALKLLKPDIAKKMLIIFVGTTLLFELNHVMIKFEPPADSAGHQDKMYHPISDYPPILFAGKDKFRHISVNAALNWDPSYFISLRHNIATHYGLMSLNGFRSDLDSDLQETLKYIKNMPPSIVPLQRYGVKYATYFIVDNGSESTIEFSHINLLAPVRAGATFLGVKKQMAYFEIPNPDPLAFTEKDQKSLPIKFDTAGADVNITGVLPGSTVIVNLLWRHRYYAYCGGRELPIAKDEWGRMKLVIPQQTDKLEIRYRSPWVLGALVGLAIALVAGVLLYLSTRPEKRKAKGQTRHNT